MQERRPGRTSERWPHCCCATINGSMYTCTKQREERSPCSSMPLPRLPDAHGGTITGMAAAGQLLRPSVIADRAAAGTDACIGEAAKLSLAELHHTDYAKPRARSAKKLRS